MVSPTSSIATGPGGVRDVVIEACHFIGGISNTFGVQVTADSRDVFVSDSFFEDMLAGVSISAGAPVEGVVVESCRFRGHPDTTEAHILFLGSGGFKSLRVAQCEFRPSLIAGVGRAAIMLGAGTKTGVTIEGCVFQGINGISGSEVQLMTVTGCTFDPEDLSPDYAVSLTVSTQVSVTGNVLRSPESYTDGFVFDGLERLSVAGNQISNCPGDGIRVTGSVDVEIVGNTVFACGGNGIEVESGSHVTIEANVTRANSGHGILVAVGATTPINVVVGGNVSSNNGMDGLNLTANNLAVNCNVCCNNAGTDINFAGGAAGTHTYVGNVRTTDLNAPPASAANATCV
jgi:hypothetical protein